MLLEVKNLHKRFNDKEILKGIDFNIDSGEVVVIIGPSGSGKTTLLRNLNFLESADQGTLRLHRSAKQRGRTDIWPRHRTKEG